MNMTLTNNFYNWLRTNILSDSSNHNTILNSSEGIKSSDMKVLGTIKNTSGQELSTIAATDYNMSWWSNVNLFYFNNSNTGGANSGYPENRTYFVIGSGSTAATASDYALASAVSGGYTCTLTGYHVFTDNKGKATFSLTVLNNGNSPSVTINEIGLVKQLVDGRLGKTVLLGRCVLDEAVTLALGESRTFDITVSF